MSRRVVLAFATQIDATDGAWNHVAPIFEGERRRIQAIPRGDRGKRGEAYSITREMADEAIRNLEAIQGGEIPILLRHPFEREATLGALPSAEFRRLGHVAELQVSADGAWLDGRYVWTEEGRALVASGQFPQMSPTVFFDTQDRDGNPVGCSIFEVSLVPVGEFRDQGRLAAAADADADESADMPEDGIMKRVMELLGVADEAGVVPALEKMVEERNAMSAGVQSFTAEMATLKESRGKDRERLVALEAKVATSEATALVAEGRAAGKIIPATEKIWFEDAVENLARTRERLAVAPAVKSFGARGGVNGARAARAADSPTDASARIDTEAKKLVSEGKAKSYRDAVEMAMAASPELATTFSAVGPGGDPDEED